MTSQKLRHGPKDLCTIWILPENKWWAAKEVGTKNMWVTLARGVFIYGTHMTRNITANNTTNTQTLVTLYGQKKLPNKCHTNHPVVVKPLSKQATKFWLGTSAQRKKYFNHKKSWGSILTPCTSFFSAFILHLFFNCVCEEEKSRKYSFKSYIFLFLKFCMMSAPSKRSEH